MEYDFGWSDIERGALINFLAADGPVRSALTKFTQYRAAEAKAMCTMAMGTVPRNPELAADHAAKAQAFDEFWDVLADAVNQGDQVETRTL